jgi:hypothetical protein
MQAKVPADKEATKNRPANAVKKSVQLAWALYFLNHL